MYVFWRKVFAKIRYGLAMDRVHGKERFPLITWRVGIMYTRWLSSSIAARAPNMSGLMPTNNLQGRTGSHFVLSCATEPSVWDTSEVASLSARVWEADTTSTALSWTASTSTRGTGLANCACVWSSRREFGGVDRECVRSTTWLSMA